MSTKWREQLTVYNCVLTLMSKLQSPVWMGTATALYSELQPYLADWTYGRLPTNERALAYRMRHSVGTFRAMGHLDVSFKRQGKRGTRLVIIRKHEDFPAGQPPYIRF
jgi:hypothetical protein